MSRSRIGPVAVPVLVVGVVLMLVVPLPPFLIDLLVATSIALAIVVLLTSMFVRRPLDFSIFPSLLLIATLFRLALNVSTARAVLTDGYAGKVVQAFGHIVIGGNLVVGLVIFFILVVIQFVVITNGAGRVAEVAARFTLDAMPGKQMAIDADLNSGLISEDEARRRRKEIAAEADFYGAMDGASKFVKGDAIAAIIITVLNLVGGFVIGVLQRGMDLSQAMSTYALLTVGDGLVSQVPALLIAIAAGLIVTRAATEQDLGSDLISQIGAHRRVLQIAGGSILAFALMPGIPKLPFLALGGGLLLVASRVEGRVDADPVVTDPAAAEGVRRETPEELVAASRVDPLELEIGYGLVDLVDSARGGDLLDRVRALRRKIAMEIGIVIPPVRTRDSFDLPDTTYAIRVHGVEVGRGEAPQGKILVLGPVPPGIPAQPTLDPVFGTEAAWVPAEFGVHAEVSGATVIDRGSVITAHLAEVVRLNATRILSRQDVKLLVDAVKGTDPVVVDELNASGLSLADVQQVLHDLLDEQVSVRDLVRILEAVSARGRQSKEREVLTEAARAALGPAIAAAHASGRRLCVITIDPLFEHSLVERVRAGDGGTFLALDADAMQAILSTLAELHRMAEQRGDRPALVCSPALRASLRRLTRTSLPLLPVLSYGELGDQLEIETIGVLRPDQLLRV
ncbi:MAG: flagellar biosynthesis protein FlhA [Acidimicrobiales bacterium]